MFENFATQQLLLNAFIGVMQQAAKEVIPLLVSNTEGTARLDFNIVLTEEARERIIRPRFMPTPTQENQDKEEADLGLGVEKGEKYRRIKSEIFTPKVLNICKVTTYSGNLCKSGTGTTFEISVENQHNENGLEIDWSKSTLKSDKFDFVFTPPTTAPESERTVGDAVFQKKKRNPNK